VAEPGEKAALVDHLSDILLVLAGQPRMRTEEVLSALAARNPLVYRSWSHGDLKACLAPWGAKPYKTAGFMQVSAERVREAIARRDGGEEPEPDES
jgi:S-DNA-T family DNA segregation ATPase FtsK/SpoIIIE